MLVFQVGGKPEYSEENPRSINQEPTTNSSNIQHQAGIKPRPCWWQVSALTTAPVLLLISAGFSFKMEELDFYLWYTCLHPLSTADSIYMYYSIQLSIKLINIRSEYMSWWVSTLINWISNLLHSLTFSLPHSHSVNQSEMHYPKYLRIYF